MILFLSSIVTLHTKLKLERLKKRGKKVAQRWTVKPERGAYLALTLTSWV